MEVEDRPPPTACQVTVTGFTEPLALGESEPFAEPRVPTGDAQFDRKLPLYGTLAICRAAMNAQTRQDLLNQPVSLAYSQAKVHLAVGDWIVPWVQMAVRLQRRFVEAAEHTEVLLEENVRMDPEPGVQQKSLEALVGLGARDRLVSLAHDVVLPARLRLMAAEAADVSEVIEQLSNPQGRLMVAPVEGGGLSASEE